MIWFNNNVASTQQITTPTSTNKSGSTNPVSSTPNPYNTGDVLQTTNYSTAPTGNSSYPVGQLMFEDPSLASRFSKFFLGSSNTILKLGSNWLGRAFINLVAGNVPIFTSSQASLQISNNVSTWIARSDLVRTGATPYQSALLQDVGIRNVSDLATVQNPTDQSILASRISTASIARGQPIVVDQSIVSSWVSSAIQLPKYL